MIEFQSTRPRGRDKPGVPIVLFNLARFNPHAREGVTGVIWELQSSKGVSIHTPARA